MSNEPEATIEQDEMDKFLKSLGITEADLNEPLKTLELMIDELDRTCEHVGMPKIERPENMTFTQMGKHLKKLSSELSKELKRQRKVSNGS